MSRSATISLQTGTNVPLPGQFHELVERGDLHRALRAAAASMPPRRPRPPHRITPARAAPVHHSNCCARLRHEHVEPADRRAAGRRRGPQQARRRRVVDQVVDEAAPQATPAAAFRAVTRLRTASSPRVPTGVAFTSTSHAPAAGRARGLAPAQGGDRLRLRLPPGVRPSRGRRGRRGQAPRRGRPRPRRGSTTRAPSSGTRPVKRAPGSRRRPCCRPSHRPPAIRSVLSAPTRRASLVERVRAGHHATLKGAVTLAPERPSARANATKSSASDARAGR